MKSQDDYLKEEVHFATQADQYKDWVVSRVVKKINMAQVVVSIEQVLFGMVLISMPNFNSIGWDSHSRTDLSQQKRQFVCLRSQVEEIANQSIVNSFTF